MWLSHSTIECGCSTAQFEEKDMAQDEKGKVEKMHDSARPNHQDRMNPKGTAPTSGTNPC